MNDSQSGLQVKLLKRLKALLAMSEDSSSENEAQIAMRRLHSLLAKHNISLTDLEEEDEKIDRESFEEYNWPWKRFILLGVSELYFCKSYYSMNRKNYADYFVVGTESNRLVAASMIKMIITTLELEAKRECKKAHGKQNSTFNTSFKTAAALRIHTRCQELIQMAKDGSLTDDDGSLLPVMVDTYNHHAANNDDFLSDMGLVKRKSRTKAFDAAGNAAGKKAGNRVQLSRGIQSKNATRLLN